MKNHVRSSKYDPPVIPATLLHVNPHYAHVKLPSGVETTVSLQEVAPFEHVETNLSENVGEQVQPLEQPSHKFFRQKSAKCLI